MRRDLIQIWAPVIAMISLAGLAWRMDQRRADAVSQLETMKDIVAARETAWIEFVEADRAAVLADVNSSLMRISKMFGKPEMTLTYDEHVDGSATFGFKTTVPVTEADE